METTENTDLISLKLKLIENILLINEPNVLQEILQLLVPQEVVSEQEMTAEVYETFGDTPLFVVKKMYDENAPYPKVELGEEEYLLKGIRNKQTKMYQNMEDLPNYDENMLHEEQSAGFAKVLQNVGNLFDDEPPIEELLKDLTA